MSERTITARLGAYAPGFVPPEVGGLISFNTIEGTFRVVKAQQIRGYKEGGFPTWQIEAIKEQ